MPKLPGVNHLDVIRALGKVGFWVLRQGKHVIMTADEIDGEIPLAEALAVFLGFKADRPLSRAVGTLRP